MSLFRNVFISHKDNDPGPEAAAPERVSEGNDLAQEEALSSSISAEFGDVDSEAPVLGEPKPVSGPFVLDNLEPVDESPVTPDNEVPTGQYDPLIRADMDPKPDREHVLTPQQRARALDPQLVERAARAQSEIEKTQMEQQLHRAPRTPEDACAGGTTQPPAPAEKPAEATTQTPLLQRSRSARRVRTRMLGFGEGTDAVTDPFENPSEARSTQTKLHPVGWIVVTKGPGEGQSFPLHFGVSTIGRGGDQTVVLDFGDSSISRGKHAAIAYDDEINSFFLGHGGKSNIVRLNGRPVLSTEDLCHGDTIKIGETTLRFVALCGANFTWGTPDHA